MKKMSVFPPRAVKCGFLDFVVDPFHPVKNGATQPTASKDVEKKKEKKKTSRKKHAFELTSPQLTLLQRLLHEAPRGLVLTQDDKQVLRRLRLMLAQV